MSKQLALSIVLSVMAMTAFAVLGVDAAGWQAGSNGLHLPLSAKAPNLPDFSQLLPTIQ